MIDQAGLLKIRPRIGIFQAGKYGRDDGEPSARFEKIERQTLRHSYGAAGDGELPG